MQSALIVGMTMQRTALALAAIMVLLNGCSEVEPEPELTEVTAVLPTSTFEILNPELNRSAEQIALDYVGQIGADFEQVRTDISLLRSAIDALLDEASIENLQRAKEAWLAAHSSYELTTLHRYFAAQMLSDQNGLELLQLHYQIDHWPIVPGYIDYVDGYPDSGIVHDVNVALNDVSLRGQHGAFDVSEVTLGFHVIEYLLWGHAGDADTRPVNDYAAIERLSPAQIESGYTLEQLPNNRRRQLLGTVADTLLEDFLGLQSLWFTQMPVVRQSIEATTGPEVIVILADSMAAMLTEELLLRSLYPMLNGELVDSVQSPYSQTTQNAVSTQLSALERLLLERQTQDGTTLDVIFSAVSDEFSEFFYQNFDASKSCLVLLYSNIDSETAELPNRSEIEIVECINLLTNMIDHIERLKFDLMN